jgi:tetratricopeptide (TPR) repeat protein
MKRAITILTIIILVFPFSLLIAQDKPVAATQGTTAAPASDFASGMKLYRQGRYAQAIAAFDAVPADSPDYAAACYFAGYAHYVMKHYQQAVDSFGKAFKANPALDPRPYFHSR